MITAKHFYMIRHGQTEANEALLMAGSTDSPLTAKGRDQARLVQQVVTQLTVKPAIIAHSHLSRARDTASIINEALGLEMVEIPELAEMHAGDLEGKSYKECEAFHHEWQNPPGGETYEEFFARIRKGKNKALELPGPVLIVCHGGVMKGFGKMQGLPMNGIFRNCHLHEFHPSDDYEIFPWHTIDYDICAQSGKIIENTKTVYHLDRLSMTQTDVIAL